MKAISLLLLVVLAALAETHSGNHKKRAKRELLARSKRRWVLNTIEVVEEDPGPFPKDISQMFNDKISQNGGTHMFRLSGMGVTEEPMEVFSIDEKTGMVKALKAIDREVYASFHIKFDILDKNTGQKIDRELAFDIEIKDINDNPPRFSQSFIKADVQENMPEGYLPVQLHFTDIDQSNTSNSQITISVISQKPLEPKIDVHQIDGRMAQLTFKGCFDYDKAKKYEVIVQAKDHGTPSLSSTANVLMNIVDANTHPPMFKKKEYQAEIQELTTKNDILRFAVEDQDIPKTPGWRAKYFFIKGNEEGNYKLETDPETNEGILSVIKGKDYERTTLATLQIRVENEEPLFVCKNKGSRTATFSDSINATIKVIDVNDPPQFEKDKVDVYKKEEEPTGQELFTPKIYDIDSDVSKIRYVLLKDPADWAAIDKETGTVKTTKKMDRESPFVDSNNIYQILIGAIDDGEPPATGTCTIQVHLADINDNTPRLVNNSVILCGNKANKVMVLAKDADVDPYSGPFTFSFGEGKSQSERWKLEPSFGDEGGLVSLKPLPYGNYSVPLVIQDQQNTIGRQTLEVTVCDCGRGHVCHKITRKAHLTSLGLPAIGFILLALLLFLLLLFVFVCEFGKKFNHLPSGQDEGNQTLIKYNQEGGGAACRSEPGLIYKPTNGVHLTRASMQMSQMAPAMTQEVDMYDSGFNSNYYRNSLGTQRHRDTIKSNGGQTRYSTLTSTRTNNFQGSLKFQRTLSLRSQPQLVDQIQRRLDMLNENAAGYQPCTYEYEGKESKCQSLDELSLSNLGDELDFLNDLGPKFKALGTICHQEMKEKNTQL